MKTCTKCKADKLEHEFRKRASSKDGLQSACKDCQRARDKSDYLKASRKEQITSRRDRLYKEHQSLIYSYLVEHPCVDCGNDNPVVLQFDHVRGKKVAGISTMIGRYSTNNILAEIAKCEVRCANCHTKKTAKDFGWFKAFAGLV